jgi:hypothetical protein
LYSIWHFVADRIWCLIRHTLCVPCTQPLY